MDMDEALMTVKCECGNEIKIRKVWYPGGCNDYGSFELRCNKCGKTLIVDIGRDVDASEVLDGGELISKKYRD